MPGEDLNPEEKAALAKASVPTSPQGDDSTDDATKVASYNAIFGTTFKTVEEIKASEKKKEAEAFANAGRILSEKKKEGNQQEQQPQANSQLLEETILLAKDPSLEYVMDLAKTVAKATGKGLIETISEQAWLVEKAKAEASRKNSEGRMTPPSSQSVTEKAKSEEDAIAARLNASLPTAFRKKS